MFSSANELMDHAPFTTTVDTPVADFARALLESGHEGACVLGEGELLGVVTSMDLIFQEKNIHLPTFVAFMDAFIPLGGFKRASEEMRKITGLKVGDIMTRDPVTVTPDTSAADMATLMVERHISMLPVVNEGKLVGVVEKRSILAAAFPPR